MPSPILFHSLTSIPPSSFGYNLSGAGRWISLPLKKKKKAGGKKRKPKAIEPTPRASSVEKDDEDDEMKEVGSGGEEEHHDDEPKPWEAAKEAKEVAAGQEAEMDDPDDPEKSIPFARYNTMLAVQRSTLYMCVPSLFAFCFRAEKLMRFRFWQLWGYSRGGLEGVYVS